MTVAGRLGAATAAVAVTLSLSVPTAVNSTRPARAADPGSAAAALPARITLTALEPRAPTPTDTLVVQGTVQNTGFGELQSLRVRLRASDRRLSSRSALAEQATADTVLGVAVSADGASQRLPALGPQATATFRLTTPVSALGLRRTGVYPLSVEVRGESAFDSTADGVNGGVETVGRLRTWLPFTTPADPVKPTRIAWVWPLATAPDRRPDGTFPSDRLAAELGSRGRLTALLRAAGAARAPASGAGAVPVPVTYAVDPALLEALTAMADGYRVRAPNGSLVAGAGGAAARGYLTRLRQLTRVDPVLALPYADPDVVALVRAGRAGDVGRATGPPTFPQLVESALDTTLLDHIAWPPDGLVTRRALDALTGIDTVVLAGRALPPQPSLAYTPDAVTTLPAATGGTLRAIVSDATLDALVAAPVRTAQVRLAEQRFLAETLLISAELPGTPRSVVVTPPRRWAPSAAWATALLGDSGRVPWLTPLTLPAITRPAVRAAERAALSYPAEAARAELPPRVFRGSRSVATAATALATFSAVLTDPAAAGVPALERALLRGVSSAWRSDPAAGQALRTATLRTLQASLGKVRITSGGNVSVASKTSTIPISVANGLAQPVRVQVALRSTAARLVGPDRGVQEIDAGHQRQLSVRLEAPSAGVFPVYASLLTPEGRPYGEPVKLRVHSTRYGTLALGITVGALVVLLLAAGVRLARRLRSARRAEPGR